MLTKWWTKGGRSEDEVQVISMKEEMYEQIVRNGVKYVLPLLLMIIMVTIYLHF